MTEIIKSRSGVRRHQGSTPNAGSYGAFGPVIRSAVGVVRESVCLLGSVAELGIVLISDSKPSTPVRQAAPRLRAAGCANVIPFPMSSKDNSRE